MKNVTTHYGRLHIIKRDKSSANGNPRYIATIDGYRFKTPVDSHWGYVLTNYDGKYCKADIGRHYGTLTLDHIKEAIEPKD